MRLFIADDSAILREKMIGVLSGLKGVQVIGQARGATEAFRDICRLKPDVVTLDINLVGGSGIEVLRRIKQIDRPPVVLMLTNLASLPYRKRCLKAGADFFIDKSTEIGKVKEIIQGLIERFDSEAVEGPEFNPVDDEH